MSNFEYDDEPKWKPKTISKMQKISWLVVGITLFVPNLYIGIKTFSIYFGR